MDLKKGEYKSESAGILMTQNIPVVLKDQKVRDVLELLKKSNFDVVNYIYVVDSKKKFIGSISIKEIFRNSSNVSVKKIMKEDVVYVKTHTHQERVAYLALKYKLKNVAVVDKDDVLVGAVSYHNILKIMQKEGIEDLLHQAGIHKFIDPAVEIINASTMTHLKKRLPWLLIGLFGGILAAFIVGLFESLLKIYVVLAAFIPAVVYMSDAVGSQAQTIFIRSIALDKDLNYRFYSFREFKINLMLGLILGLIFYFIVLIFWDNSFFGFVIGISILLTVVSSMIISILLPFIFNKFNYDPAISTGPFATAIRDLSSLVIYFLIARMMISVFLVG
jgi:magnesium transporter